MPLMKNKLKLTMKNFQFDLKIYFKLKRIKSENFEL